MRNLLLLLLFTCSLSLYAQQNISLLAKFPYAYTLSNVWGYTDETNVEYALVGVEDGLSVVSLATPSNPIEIAKIPGAINKWREIKTFGDYAYVSSESGDGLLIVDLSPLPSSTSLNYVYKTFTKNTQTCHRAHSLAIDEKGFCYLFGTDRNQETVILDIKTDPMNPTEVGSTGMYYAHDGIVDGDTMFLAHIMAGFVGAYNISDRANPQFITSFNTPLKFPHNIALSADAHYLFTTDEKTGSFVASYDISDFNNIVELDRFQREDQRFPMVHNTHMKNGYLVNSYYLEGLNIVDAHDPQNLVEIGYYDTTPNDSGYFFRGVWGVYPYFASGIVLASDIQQGLYVFSANYQRASYVSGTVNDLESTAPIYNVLVSIEGESVKDYTDILGVYRSGLGKSGNVTFQFSKKGYYDTSVVVNLMAANTQMANVYMRPKPNFNLVFKVVDKNNKSISMAKIIIESEDGEWMINTDNSGIAKATIAGENFKVNVGKWMYISTCNEKTNADFTDTSVYVLLNGVYDDFTFDYSWTATGDIDKGLWVRTVPFGSIFDEILVILCNFFCEHF
ncbi:MAG: choice-of-anchor B family protein, partial [Flavobacteriales bacterium]